MIPPNINFNRPNPNSMLHLLSWLLERGKLILRVTVPWTRGQLVVPTEPTRWPRTRHQRASVNSFGIGGSNCRKFCNTDNLKTYLGSLNTLRRHPGFRCLAWP
jgi:hypothetical protein